MTNTSESTTRKSRLGNLRRFLFRRVNDFASPPESKKLPFYQVYKNMSPVTCNPVTLDIQTGKQDIPK